jgi:hypothetical protein
MEAALKLRFMDVRKQHSRVDDPLMWQKAEQLAKKMGKDDFVSTERWFIYIRKYRNSKTSIYRYRTYRFPGSIIQFLWSLSISYLNNGNKTHINHSSIYRFQHLWVKIVGPDER